MCSATDGSSPANELFSPTPRTKILAKLKSLPTVMPGSMRCTSSSESVWVSSSRSESIADTGTLASCSVVGRLVEVITTSSIGSSACADAPAKPASSSATPIAPR